MIAYSYWLHSPQEGESDVTIIGYGRSRESARSACVDTHLHSEAENDVEAALELYTDDIVFEAAALNGLNRLFSGKQAVAKFYRELWATMSNVQFQSLQRFAT